MLDFSAQKHSLPSMAPNNLKHTLEIEVALRKGHIHGEKKPDLSTP